MIVGHKVGGQGRWSRSGYRSRVKSGEGSMSGVKDWGGVKVVVKVGGQGQGSRS